MKLLFLQLLLLFCLALQLVPGKVKQRRKKYIFDPPPCKSAPESCTQVCVHHEDCQIGLECCSSFCGIVCSRNKKSMSKRLPVN
ncbi:WAP four-disulfide core domain protein 13 [Trichechus manatus latirostris]|uniref:WAP four-disulfide core domain protein 13 n=1 Tax=Trichechus manatus latirostris TaxID=127582 RepID=A0A2Y9G453_TRIMA|nr:WAP four-disulfide core domain protein 13 [Trichechus manatus latirostris]